MGNISEREFKDRLKKIRELMRQKQIDALIVYSWKRGQTKYISGYYPNYVANTAAVLITPNKDPKMYIRFPFDIERAKSVSWITNIQASGSNEKIASDISSDLSKLNIPVRQIGIIGGDKAMDEIPHSFVQILKEDFRETNIFDAREIIEELRIIKSPDELEIIRRSAIIADNAIRHAKRIISPGMTEMDIVVEAESFIRKNGGNQHLVVIAAPGNRKLIRPATMRKIEKGEDIIVEAAVEVDGYWSQTAATFYCGSPTIEQRKIISAVKDTYEKTVEAIKPGKTCAEIAQISIDYLNQLGYGDYMEQDFGHGIGLDLPEPPKLELADQTMIKEGMIIVVHPAIRVKGIGSAFIGGTTYITNSGVEELHEIRSLYI